jgi:nucleotide-binding universal stress UspA family protein
LYKKILIATDGSEHAKHALDHAVESAVKWGAELIILTVVPPAYPLVYSNELISKYISKLQDDLRESHHRILREAENMVKNKQPDIKVVTRLEEGHPSSKIIETAKEEDVDLIVMGSRGMGGIVGFIGSTSRYVVEACTKPILIVK